MIHRAVPSSPNTTLICFAQRGAEWNCRTGLFPDGYHKKKLKNKKNKNVGRRERSLSQKPPLFPREEEEDARFALRARLGSRRQPLGGVLRVPVRRWWPPRVPSRTWVPSGKGAAPPGSPRGAGFWLRGPFLGRGEEEEPLAWPPAP